MNLVTNDRIAPSIVSREFVKLLWRIKIGENPRNATNKIGSVDAIGLACRRQYWKNLMRMIKRMKETWLMEITERRAADIVTLTVSGKLDSTTAKAFEERILTRIESGDRRFIIDLGQLDYIGSAGRPLQPSVSTVRTGRWCCAGISSSAKLTSGHRRFLASQ